MSQTNSLHVNSRLLTFVGLAIACTLFFYVRNKNLKVEERLILQKLDNIQFTFQEKLSKDINTLRALKSYYQVHSPSFSDFEKFSQKLLEESSYITALEWVPKVNKQNRSKFERDMRKMGYNDFHFTKKVAGVMQKDDEREFYYPVYYVTPYIDNQAAHGFNLGSHPGRLKAIEYAFSSMDMSYTEPIQLVQDQERKNAILLFIPVDNDSLVLALLRIEDELTDTLKSEKIDDLNITVKDITDVENPLMIAGKQNQAQIGTLTKKTKMNTGGRIWEIEGTTLKNYQFHSSHWWILGLSVLFIFMINQYFHSLHKINQKVSKQVIEKTTDLQTIKNELESQLYVLDEHSLVSITDPKGKIIHANKKFCEVSQYSLEELIGNDHRIINSGFHSKEFIKNLWETIKAGKVWKGEVCNKAKDGSLYWVNSTIMGFKDNSGEIQKYVSIRTNITQEKELVDKYKEASVDAEEANKYKSQFLANMSHEIRTPLNAIVGYTELLRDTELEAEQGNMVSTIKSASDSLLELINDILDLSKIESGEINLEFLPFDLFETLLEINKQCLSKLDGKNIDLHIVTDDEYEQIIGDKLRIKQIFINLVGNALKFTDSGEIISEVKTVKETEDSITLKFSVKDTGIGIPKDKQENIFKAFKQADGSTTRKYGGTGLGLNITKKFIEMMDSKIELSSEVGIGSIFSFTINFPKKVGSKKTLPVLTDLKDKKLMLIDDNQTSQKLVEKLCRSQNILFESCDTISTALKLDTVSLDFILLDADLALRNPNQFNKLTSIVDQHNIKLVAVTSDIRISTLTFIKKSLFHDYLLKPYAPDNFYNLLKDVSQESEKTRTILKEDFNISAKILVVEDNITNQKLAEKMLKKLGHSVTIAENGQIAIEMINTNNYDLILMDMQMPVMDGITATKKLRSMGRKDIIIAQTANAFDTDKAMCKEAGMNAFLTKPLSKDKINALIKEFCKDKQEDLPTSKMILVEDDKTTAEIMKIFISGNFSNLEIKVAESGIEACSLLGSFEPHIMILDINLPDMDGIDVLKFIRDRKEYSKMKIVLNSSLDENDEKYIEAMKYQIDAELNKSNDKNRIIDTLEKLMK